MQKLQNSDTQAMLNLQPGNLLFKKGQVGGDLYLIVEGKLERYNEDANGNKLIIDEIIKGQLIGEMSFFDKRPKSANVRAITDCSLIKIPAGSVAKHLDLQPEIVRVLIKNLTSRMRLLSDKYEKANN